MEGRISKGNLSWLNLYLINLLQLNKSAHTIKNYRADLLKFLLWYQYSLKKSLRKINGNTISDYKIFLGEGGIIKGYNGNVLLNSIYNLFKILLRQKNPHQSMLHWEYLQAPLSVSSRRRHLSSISNFFEFLKQYNADRSRIFRINPVRPKLHGITLKQSDITPTKILRSSDWDKICESVYRTDERLIIYLLYWGGLRLEELVNLKISQFDTERKMINFKRKGGSTHELLMQKRDMIFNQLNYYLINCHSGENDYLFMGKVHGPLTSKAMYNKIIKILKKAKTAHGLTPHSFRKACATNLYRRSKDLLLVRDYLNHSDAMVTQTYIDKEILQKEAMLLN